MAGEETLHADWGTTRVTWRRPMKKRVLIDTSSAILLYKTGWMACLMAYALTCPTGNLKFFLP